MNHRPTATVRPVAEAKATGKVAEIFADIRRVKHIDFVLNFWRVLATNPDHLELIWRMFFQPGKLTMKTWESER